MSTLKMAVVNGAANCAFSATDPSEQVPLWLNGTQVATGLTFDVISPVEHKTVWKSSAASEEDVLRAIQSAEEAFKSWSKTKPSTRRDVFLRAAEELGKRRDEVRRLSYSETGASMAMFGFEFEASRQMLLSVAGLIEPATTSSVPISETVDMRAMVVKEPYGVVLAIAPWNAPHVLGMRACIQPLAV
jgi:acyl-CoA reductase-like NAD-dependent aldehyde dehydrogenase